MQYFSDEPIRDAQHFIGREREIVHITELLAAGRSCAIIGVEGSGKTSVLNHLAQTVAVTLDEPPLVIQVDLARMRTAGDLYQPILRSLGQTGDDELSLDQVFQNETPPLLLLLDNLERVGSAWNGVVRSALRGWIAQQKLQVIVASTLPLERIAPDLQQTLVSVELTPLIEREARALLNELAAQAGLDLPNATAGEIIHTASTQPGQLKFALDAWARSNNGEAFDWRRTVRDHQATLQQKVDDLDYTTAIETEANDVRSTISTAPPTIAPAPTPKAKPQPTYRADDPSDFLWTLILLAIAVFVGWLIHSWWGILGFIAVMFLWIAIAHALVKSDQRWRKSLYVAATRRLPIIGKFAPRE